MTFVSELGQKEQQRARQGQQNARDMKPGSRDMSRDVGIGIVRDSWRLSSQTVP